MRMIDGDKLLYDVGKELAQLLHGDREKLTADELMMMVHNAPTIDPVKHGHWDLIDGCEPMRYGCSVCHRMVWAYENYCPNCGAKMDEVSE